MQNPLVRIAVLALLLACEGCGRSAEKPHAGLQPLTDPAALTLHDLALLAGPAPGAPRIDCSGDDAKIARRLAAAETSSFSPARARLVGWGMRTLGGKRKGWLWTLESEVSDPASGTVQLIQRDYLMGEGCAYLMVAQKQLEWRHAGAVGKPGEGAVMIH